MPNLNFDEFSALKIIVHGNSYIFSPSKLYKMRYFNYSETIKLDICTIYNGPKSKIDPF